MTEIDDLLIKVRQRETDHLILAKKDLTWTILTVLLCVTVFVSSEFVNRGLERAFRSEVDRQIEGVIARFFSSFSGNIDSVQNFSRADGFKYSPSADAQFGVAPFSRLAEVQPAPKIEMPSASLGEKLKPVDIEVAEIISNKEIELANILAEKDRSVAELNADKERDLANEVTQREADVWQAVRASLTKLGSLAILFVLLRVFNLSREKNEEASYFYRALGDSLVLKKVDPQVNVFDAVMALMPPDARLGVNHRVLEVGLMKAVANVVSRK